jgi:phage/plasmid-like protein (TIGR03299 family)
MESTMSHEVESMVFSGTTPWHGIGHALNGTETTEQAMVLAGCDSPVDLIPLFAHIGTKQIPTRQYATVRRSDESLLGYVGAGYRVIQNPTAFKWFDPLIESGLVTLETAGSLRNGKRVWILAKIKADPVEIVPGDPVNRYLLLSNSHDGTFAERIGYVGIRVVCANTQRMAFEDPASKLIRIRHTKNAEQAMQIVRETMKIADREFLATAEQYKQMTRCSVDTRTLKAYVRRVFVPKMVTKGATDAELAEASTCARVIPEIIKLFESGRGSSLPGVKGTMWGAYNAATEYLNHARGKSADARLDSLWFGEAGRISDRAMTVALTMAAVG